MKGGTFATHWILYECCKSRQIVNFASTPRSDEKGSDPFSAEMDINVLETYYWKSVGRKWLFEWDDFELGYEKWFYSKACVLRFTIFFYYVNHFCYINRGQNEDRERICPIWIITWLGIFSVWVRNYEVRALFILISKTKIGCNWEKL